MAACESPLVKSGFGTVSLLLVTVCLLSCGIGVSGQAGQQQCPGPHDIEPCSCIVKKNGLDILCEFTDLFHITRAMAFLKGKPNMVIFYLKLRHNNLPKLQSFVFLGMDIRHLTMTHGLKCPAYVSEILPYQHSIPELESRQGLTQLDFSQNWLNSVPSSALKNLHHLLILNLNHNKISALHAKAFEGLDTLEILILFENKISTIDPNTFKGIEKKLKRLNLAGNELNSVPQASLSILYNLRKLELHENSISSVSEGDFEGLENLDSLGLSYNHLREVPARVFSHLKQLNSLEIEGNAIAKIDEDAFVGLEENLQYLRLGDNNLHAIPSDALRRLHRLRHLDLRANNISYVSEDAFNWCCPFYDCVFRRVFRPCDFVPQFTCDDDLPRRNSIRDETEEKHVHRRNDLPGHT
ncbi:hypothetical protein LSTR_LSTR000388 [Laodelphax striatellus]|uniref:LRRCT domain-containing protein n=1 Tax=Laodelphax striatellus TaxID=195883 RepID=A0A482X3R5_LAOST|nr:hypothetical protein LSTR_LSTR000388 [Laodelphax striatellus]